MKNHELVLAAMAYNLLHKNCSTYKDFMRPEEKFVQFIVHICLTSDNSVVLDFITCYSHDPLYLIYYFLTRKSI